MPDEMRRQNIDVKLVGAHVRVFGADFFETLIPEGHRVDDAVRFRGGGEMLLTFSGQLKSKAQNAIHTPPGEDRLLDGHLVFRALIETDRKSTRLNSSHH